eukprot:TRINITY_DN10580_c0_g2_i1.p1 TRINITY_DN10580_c0_g2~~TRINITY_DN10580_c0_g2_i1.p1  ORF type:complete len:283 (-),score=-31.47 TRINITY_DN10580_c0_g2_i1:89-937(-)
MKNKKQKQTRYAMSFVNIYANDISNLQLLIHPMYTLINIYQLRIYQFLFQLILNSPHGKMKLIKLDTRKIVKVTKFCRKRNATSKQKCMYIYKQISNTHACIQTLFEIQSTSYASHTQKIQLQQIYHIILSYNKFQQNNLEYFTQGQKYFTRHKLQQQQFAQNYKKKSRNKIAFHFQQHFQNKKYHINIIILIYFWQFLLKNNTFKLQVLQKLCLKTRTIPRKYHSTVIFIAFMVYLQIQKYVYEYNLIQLSLCMKILLKICKTSAYKMKYIYFILLITMNK